MRGYPEFEHANLKVNLLSHGSLLVLNLDLAVYPDNLLRALVFFQLWKG